MKKKVLWILLSLLLCCACFAACAANSVPSGEVIQPDEMNGSVRRNVPTVAFPADFEAKRMEASEPTSQAFEAEGRDSVRQDSGRMIALTYSFQLESTDYEKDVATLDRLIAENEGYISSSDLSVQPSKEKDLHSAFFQVKIPRDKAEFFRKAVTAEVGTLRSSSSNSQDFTESYSDTALRLVSEKKKLEAFNALYKRAESMEDIMAIQSQIIDCQSRIDQMEASQRVIEGKVNFSDFSISLKEVFLLSPVASQDPSFSSRLSEAFAASLTGLKSGLEELLLFIVEFWPILLVLIFIVLLIVGFKRRVASRRKKKEEKAEARVSAVKSAETRVTGAKITEARATEAKPVEAKTADNKSSERSSSGSDSN